MKRRGFLGGAVGLFVGLRHGQFPPAVAPEAALPAAIKKTASSRLAASGGLFASGGLCAPLTPIYDIHHLGPRSPLVDALPSFSAPRGLDVES